MAFSEALPPVIVIECVETDAMVCPDAIALEPGLSMIQPVPHPTVEEIPVIVADPDAMLQETTGAMTPSRLE